MIYKILWSSRSRRFENIREFLVEVWPVIKIHKMFRFCPECLLHVQLKSCIFWVLICQMFILQNKMKQDKWKQSKYTPSYTSTIGCQYHTIFFFSNKSKHHANFVSVLVFDLGWPEWKCKTRLICKFYLVEPDFIIIFPSSNIVSILRYNEKKSLKLINQ